MQIFSEDFSFLGNCKENNEDHQFQVGIKSEIFAVSLRREKKKELLGIKRMKNLNTKVKNFYGIPNN